MDSVHDQVQLYIFVFILKDFLSLLTTYTEAYPSFKISEIDLEFLVMKTQAGLHTGLFSYGCLVPLKNCHFS